MTDDARKNALKTFRLEDKTLNPFIADNALASGHYPYAKKMKRKSYEKKLFKLQIELLKLQRSIAQTGERVVIVFEGRDTAGKGGILTRGTPMWWRFQSRQMWSGDNGIFNAM